MDWNSQLLSIQEKKAPKVLWWMVCFLERMYTYGMTRHRERERRQSQKMDVPVISIGNITAGGTGKTPCLMGLAEEIQKAGFRPAILTRGYRSKWEYHGGVVSDGTRLLAERKQAGDEPYMMAWKLPGVPVYVGKDRIKSAKQAIQNGCDILLLDDGFQYWKMKRDLDIVLIDATCPFSNHHLLPAGWLREPMSTLARADIFFITKSDQVSLAEIEEIKKNLADVAESVPVVLSCHEPKGCISIKRWQKKEKTVEDISGKKVLLLSGIGNPKAFRETAMHAGLVPVAEEIFPDHHEYTKEDRVKIEEKAKSLGIETVVMTEKDAVKIVSLIEEEREAVSYYVLPIVMTYDQESEKWIREQWEALL